MDLALPDADHPARLAWRAWLAEHPEPTGRQLAEAGYVAPHWPRPWGLDAGPLEQLVIDDELRRSGVRRPANPIGIGWAGPTLLHAGTPAQQQRYLLPLLAGEEIWCQLFSEPDAGSDLASLTTRAVADGDEWVVTGRKVWTSLAHQAHLAILLARTDPDAPAQQGISYFICPMSAPGVTVRPIVDMTGTHTFNEVTLDDVRLSADHLVGRPHQGWALAKVTLGNERVSLSGEGALWGMGPTAGDLVEDVAAAQRASGDAGPASALAPPTLRADERDRVVGAWVDGEVLRILRLRMVGSALAGQAPGPEASVRKALADRHGQHLMHLAKDLAGPAGMLAGRSGPASCPPEGRRWPEEMWASGFTFSPALTIGGGTAEVQRDIIAERVLDLPRNVTSSS